MSGEASEKMGMCTDMYKKGLCSISFRSLTAKEIIKLAYKTGLDCIEWGSDVHAKPDDDKALLEIVNLSKQYGIECSSYGSYFRIGSDPVSDIHKYIKAAKTLGTDTIRLWCGNKPSADYTEDEKEQIYKECISLAQIAKNEKVYLCLECHINTLTDDMASTQALMKRVNSPNFCMYWQPNQFKTVQENILYAKSISNITKRIHVFNWEGKNKYPLEDAIKVWQNYLECFGEGILLLEFMPDNDPESLEREVSSLKKIIGENK